MVSSSGSGVAAVMAWPSCASSSSGSGTKARRCRCLSAVEWQFLTIASSQAFASEPRSPSNPRKARSTASCTTSSASPGACDNHRPNLYDAAKCGKTCASNGARFSSMDAKTHGSPSLFPLGRSCPPLRRTCPQEQVLLDGHEPVRGTNQRGGRELRDTVDFDRNLVLFADFLHQQIEIAVARRQHDNIRLRREFEHVQGDAHVPVAFCGAVGSLNEGPQFHFEANRAQDVLKLILLRIAAVDRERGRLDDLPAAGGFVPKTVVIEVAREALPRRVVDILHIDEDRHLLRRMRHSRKK